MPGTGTVGQNATTVAQWTTVGEQQSAIGECCNLWNAELCSDGGAQRMYRDRDRETLDVLPYLKVSRKIDTKKKGRY